MMTVDLKAGLLGKISAVLRDHNSYLEIVQRFINEAELATEYENETHFLEDVFHSDNKSFFTISSKESFNTFVTDDDAHLPFIYTPLNDHSRVHMHRGDLVFCYRQGQFGSLDEALSQRGIYGLGIVASDPQILFPDKQNHEKYGVLVILPFAFDHHLELREIQLNPSTINLTPYNGNRNDALQYIESTEHIQSLLEMIARCNPNKRREIELVSGRVLKVHKLPSEIWSEHDCERLPNSFYQKIFFGAPGTGKSFKVNKLVGDTENVFRTTFHPDYDYAQFVGSYKPTKVRDQQGNSSQDANGCDVLTYSFIPQVFAKAYVAAWKRILNSDIPENVKSVYLVIEEINRGNCAQIFGDIFQLLDRKDGYSEYPIDVDSDFAAYIRETLGDKFPTYKEMICSYCEDAAIANATPDDEFCKIALPPNFNILATMNTSDQSLFPMDSAFKRRFDWEYVPIDDMQENAKFFIEVGDTKYSWLDFLKAVNKDIAETTLSEDKQMGEFFVKPSKTEKDDKGNEIKVIDLDMFRSKVLFYLWDSVYKDETSRKTVFHFEYKDGSDDKLTFQTLFEGTKKEQISLVKKIFEKLGFKTETNGNGDDASANGGAGASPTNDNVGVVAEPENPENTEA